MQTEEALGRIKQVLAIPSVMYFEARLDSPAIVAEVAEALINEDCNVAAFPSECLIRIGRTWQLPESSH